MRLLFLESFFEGSHRDFALGLVAHSRHRIDMLTMPARHWKWRMRAAALHFSAQIDNPRRYDGLIVTDLLSLADLKALLGAACPPTLVYFHENQFAYPLASGEQRDLQFGFTDLTTALTADRVRFNSRSHQRIFFEAAAGFLQRMPDFRPEWALQAIRAKSAVLYPGCRFPAESRRPAAAPQSGPPLIIWNHRWEFDKNPEDFFDALAAVRRRGASFRLALLGQRFRRVPAAFEDARNRFEREIVQYGPAASKKEYFEWLHRGSLVVSTAVQENFGISVVEAIRCGCFPLLPHRLSYPEILPSRFHRGCLYRTREELIDGLARALAEPEALRRKAPALSLAMEDFGWPRRISQWDLELEQLGRHTACP